MTDELHAISANSLKALRQLIAETYAPLITADPTQDILQLINEKRINNAKKALIHFDNITEYKFTK